LGIEHAHLSAWLTGRHLPSLPAALAMARLFGVTVEQLALGDDAE
jgi:DNA-binding XRE family transcriptional regulator